jgi:hypothetical protein
MGVIGVFWYDRRDADAHSHNLHFSYSADHARSFERAVKISSMSSKPHPELNVRVDERWPIGSDYFGLNSTANGEFRVIWVDHRNGHPQLFHALVRVKN